MNKSGKSLKTRVTSRHAITRSVLNRDLILQTVELSPAMKCSAVPEPGIGKQVTSLQQIDKKTPTVRQRTRLRLSSSSGTIAGKIFTLGLLPEHGARHDNSSIKVENQTSSTQSKKMPIEWLGQHHSFRY